MLRREVLFETIRPVHRRRPAPPAPLSRLEPAYLMVDESCRIVECEPAVSALSNVEGDPQLPM
jgi:hypothetical protein